MRIVIYYTRQKHPVTYLSGSKLDGWVIRVELDTCFKPGREFGRGISSGQIRDDKRKMIDSDRSSGLLKQNNRWRLSPIVHSRNAEVSSCVGKKRHREEYFDDQVGKRNSKNARFREIESRDDE